ncbi:methyltransferase domain-containing protein [Actinopolymorpha pittospori]
MISQHPLGYLLGLQGIAMLRAFAGDYDREFVEARLTEIQALLDARPELGEGATLAPITTVDGYREWAQFYDEAANQLIELEQPVVREILDGLAPGRALDAACGTGRHASYLASLGHEVIGVDSSPEMLAKAQAKIPEGTFVLADLLDLPLPDDHVDLVVCALALTHVPDLEPVLAEFARVLRPGGHLVISDSRGLLGDLGLPLIKTVDGGFGYLPTWSRHTSDYLRVALPLGLQVRRCEEPRRPYPLVDVTDAEADSEDEAYTAVPGTPPNIWALHSWCVDATNAAYRGVPVAVIWDFQLSGS